VGKWIDGNWFGVLDIDTAETGQGIATIDVHGATATNTLSAASSEGECGVLFILDLDECIKDHGTTLAHIDSVSLHLRLALCVWIPSVDVELFCP